MSLLRVVQELKRRVYHHFPAEADYSAELALGIRDVVKALSDLNGRSGMFRVSGWGKTRRDIEIGIARGGVGFERIGLVDFDDLEMADFSFIVKYTRFDAKYNPIPARKDVFLLRAARMNSGIRVEVALESGPGLTSPAEVVETLREIARLDS